MPRAITPARIEWKRALIRTNGRSKDLLVPFARAYIRYFPIHAGKKRFFQRVVNPYLRWHPHEFVARTASGARIRGRSDEILQQYVYYFGTWEPNLTRWVTSQLRPGDTFVDVGANIGYFSLLAAPLIGDFGMVVAVEPSPQLFQQLLTNIGLNRAGNVRAVNVAASDSRGRVRMHSGPPTHMGLTSALQDPRLREEFEIDSLPLTEILRPEEMRKARLIKIDVEGSEALVVDGFVDMLGSARPDLEVTVEISPERLAMQGRTPEDITGAFRSAGFNCYRIDNDYSWQAYLPPPEASVPRRFDRPIEHEMDLIFSRREAPTL